MKNERHGLSIGIERVGSNFFVSFKPLGKLTHSDYETMTPVLDSALQGVNNPNIKVLVDCREFQGWDLHGAWDDFKLGLKHGRKFDRIALIAGKNWQEWAARLGTWFISGDMKSFDSEDDALAWLNTD